MKTDYDKQVESLVYRYHNDCRTIEDKQDKVKKQLNSLQSIQDDLYYDSMQLQQLLQNYTNTNDRRAYQ